VKHIIYKITNLLNGKFYIGKHSSKKNNDNYFGSGIAINNAIKKYGIKNFKKEILFEFETEQEALQQESKIVNIKLINDPNCYNMTMGGRGSFFHCQTPETREKIAKKLRGKKLSEEHKKKISSKGRKHSKTFKEKMKIRMSGINNPMYGKKHSIETLEKIRNSSTGRKLSEESRKKISKFHKGKILSLETRKKISQNQIGKKDSEETKLKKSLSHIGKRPSKETIEKLSKSLKGRKFTDEHRKKLSISASKKIGKKNPNFRNPNEKELSIIKDNLNKSINFIINKLKEEKCIMARSRLIRIIESIKKS